MALVLLLMSFLTLNLQTISAAPAPVPNTLATSATLGQRLASIAPFMNDNTNLTILYFFASDRYLSLASLKRVQVHRYDINTVEDYCSLDVQSYGVWIWESPCTTVSSGNNCSVALSTDGSLQVLDGSSAIWSSNTSGKGVQSLQLQDSGDLVLLDSSNATVWKSSDVFYKSGSDVCSAATATGGHSGPQPSAAAEGPAGLASQSSAGFYVPTITALSLPAVVATIFLA